MALISGDTCDPIFQVRLFIGDPDGTLVGDEIIDFALSNNNNDTRAAAIETLKNILAFISKESYQQVGDVVVDYNKLYTQLSKQLDRLIKDPLFTRSLGIRVGGVSKTEKDRVTSDSDFIGSPITAGDVFK